MSNFKNKSMSESSSEELKPGRRITNDDLYRNSTQFRYWSFTNSQLEDLRIQSNKKGIKTFQERVKSLDKLHPDYQPLESYLTSFVPLNFNDEQVLITYYARKCKDLSNFFHLPAQARSTAISYLFKFYLIHSVMEFHPQLIMYTSLFLAAKSENNFIGIKNFSKSIPKTTPESILQYEYQILSSLRFSLFCHHPYKPLYGFYLDIQRLLPKLDFNRLARDYDTAREWIGESIVGNCPFLFTPPQIALTALWLADDIVVERYLAKKFGLKKQKKIELDAVKEEEKEQEEGEEGEEGEEEEEGEEQEDKQEDKLEDKLEEGNEKIKSKDDDGVNVKVVVGEEIEEEVEIQTNTYVKEEDLKEENINVEMVKEEKKSTKGLSSQEHYDKMMGLIKKCSDFIKNHQINPTVEEAKRISTKVHFCLDPLKYAKKIIKHNTSISVTVTPSLDTPEPVHVDSIGVKREPANDLQGESEMKKLKTV